MILEASTPKNGIAIRSRVAPSFLCDPRVDDAPDTLVRLGAQDGELRGQRT